MYIRIFGQAGEEDFPFGKSGPWFSFKETLESEGFKIAQGAECKKIDAVVSNFHNSKISNFLAAEHIPRNMKTLIIWEPYIVDRIRYLESTLSQYGNIYAPSKSWAERVGGKFFYWPQDPINDVSVLQNWNTRIDRPLMLQGNKFSAIKGELYSLRREVIRNNNIDLLGTNWNKGFAFDWFHWSSSAINSTFSDFKMSSLKGVGRYYENYLGAPLDKNSVMKNYKIAIVIENSSDFVSEKLFDAVRNGCVVIYVGPNLNDYGIDSNSIITAEPTVKSVSEVISKVKNMSDFDLEKVAYKQFNTFIKISELWDNKKVLTNLALNIASDFKNDLI